MLRKSRNNYEDVYKSMNESLIVFTANKIIYFFQS